MSDLSSALPNSSSNSITSRMALTLLGNRYLLVLSILIVALGGYSALTNMPRIEDPTITPRFPRITTLLPGASAARVESLVTDKIEQALEEISEIDEVNSTSLAGISIINLKLKDQVTRDNVEEVNSEVQNKLKNAEADLPIEASVPFFDKNNTAVAFAKVIAINWTRDSEPSLGIMNRLAEELSDQLRGIAGTKLVRIYGAPEEEIEVKLRPDALAALNLDARQVAERIRQADPKLSAGAMRGASRNLFVEVSGEIQSLDRIRTIPIAQDDSGRVTTVGDIATVSKKWRGPPEDMTYTQGSRSILVAARVSEDVRLDRWSDASNKLIDEFRLVYGGGLEIDTLFDQSLYTNARLANLGGNLVAGAGLVMLVVFFSMGWRSALIVGSALPLSAGVALFGLNAVGQQLHQMTIFGMIIAIGLLIDNAIVMTDEVKKYLDKGYARWEAVQRSIQHLFVPLLASTLTTILGFMPVFLLPGSLGDFVGPIAISVVFALCASFCISTTLIPALGGLFISASSSSSNNTTATKERWWQSGIGSEQASKRYRALLLWCLQHRLITAAGCLVLPIAGFLLASTLGQQFFPAADRNQFEIEVRTPQDSSIEYTGHLAQQIEAIVMQDPSVTEVHWRIGGSYPTIYYNRIMREQGNNAYAHAMVFTDGIASAKRLTMELPGKLNEAFTEAQIIVAPFAQGPPVVAPVGFEISGPDIHTLRALGDEVRRIMHLVPGVVHTRATISGGQPKLDFVADEIAANQAGFTLSQIASELQTNLEGQTGGTLFEDLEELPVRVRLDERQRDSLEDMRSLLLTRDQGEDWVPLAALGEFKLKPESSGVTRIDGVRNNNIFGYITSDRLPIETTNAVLAKLEENGFEVPPGYQFKVAGDSAEQNDAFGSLITYLPVLVMLMISTIVLSFKSVRLASHIGLVAILSVGLGMLSLWFGGYARGFNAIIGSIGLIGVAINGTIVVLASIRANEQAAMGSLQHIIDETVGSTRHIVSTTLTTVGGFVPLLALSGGDFWPPLAIVMAGGVGLSITLSLIFTPVVYSMLFGRIAATNINIESESSNNQVNFLS